MKNPFLFASEAFNLRKTWPTILLIIGFSLFLICIFFPFNTTYPKLFLVCSKLADILLISGILSFLTSTLEYIGVFKNALKEVVYEAKFLENRKDIDKIWEEVSKVLFKATFPKLHHCLFDVIRKTYFPKDGVTYYENVLESTEIRYDLNNPNYIIVTEELSLNIHSFNSNEIEFTIGNIIENSGSDNLSYIKLLSCEIDGKDVKDQCIVEEIKDDINRKNEISAIKMSGKNKYFLKRKIEKRYNLNYDNFIGYRAKWLVNNMRVQVFHPSDMNINFVERGTTNDFKLIKKREDYLEYQYNGLILRRQGYIMILNT